jgi:hypothetical protein
VEGRSARRQDRLPERTAGLAGVMAVGIAKVVLGRGWESLLEHVLSGLFMVLLFGGMIAWLLTWVVGEVLDLVVGRAVPPVLAALCPGCGVEAADAAATSCPSCALPFAGRANVWCRENDARRIWAMRLLCLGIGGGIAALGALMIATAFVDHHSVWGSIALVLFGLPMFALGVLLLTFVVNGQDEKKRLDGQTWKFDDKLKDGSTAYAVDSQIRIVNGRLVYAIGHGTTTMELAALHRWPATRALTPDEVRFVRALAWLAARGLVALRWRQTTNWSRSDATVAAPSDVAATSQPPRELELLVEFVGRRGDAAAQPLLAEAGRIGRTDPSRLRPRELATTRSTAGTGADQELAERAITVALAAETDA